MIEADITYSKNTLFLTLEGMMSKRALSKIQKRMFCIIHEYDIDHIVVDIQNVINVDNEAFYDFLDRYDHEFGGKFEILE